MPFRLYNSLMGLAKESLAVVGPEGAEAGKGPDLMDLGPETDPELLALVDRLKNLLKELPKANTSTLRYIARHLRRLETYCLPVTFYVLIFVFFSNLFICSG